ncbi:GGDEF domain-containing protein [Shewanella eurypsychrophilus]|uniref:diguanylate cyclase n=1 Tax=Shewanella eurypsychrophilus TaxID=2593656 RepID=A0ABX6VA43_9GAMM|nr:MULTISPECIES: GGDEF domain-containing protein [Shewanella]QFU23110.1 diguanylate cyclase [Shewanella sp. YLB-09]QPG58393.1 GGDEF domain-containing protein [Shewanella eurypsychrophilus]
MSKEMMQLAARNLKKAVPLMLKHQIPTTPTNYALWYTYVSEQMPELNLRLDTIIEQHKTCPPTNSELLYREFVSDPVEVDVLDMRQNLEAMATELAHSLKDTNLDVTQFQRRIDSNFDKLNRIEEEGVSLEKVLGVVRGLVKESDEIRSSTQYFTGQLSKAQQEIEALKRQLEKSEQIVLYDALTSIFNRRAFDNDLKGTLSQSPDGLCLILIDIDHFKAFNDNYGHLLGDQVLKAVAKRLQEACRDGAKLYRYGGEEFAVLVPNSQLSSARHLAEAMRRGLEKVSLKDRRKDVRINKITASFGVAQWNKNLKSTEIIEIADKLLYQAKRLGRNRVMPIPG